MRQNNGVKVFSPEIINIALGQGFHLLEAGTAARVKGESVRGVPAATRCEKSHRGEPGSKSMAGEVRETRDEARETRDVHRPSSIVYPFLRNARRVPQTPGDFAVLLRIQGWARNRPVPSDLYRYMKDYDTKVMITVNDKKIPTVVEKGYVHIRRRWKAGDVITLNIPMRIRRVVAHPRVADNAGRVAVERRPIVYCAEWKDNGGMAKDTGTDRRDSCTGRY